MKKMSIAALALIVTAIGFAVAMFNPPPTQMSHWVIGLIPIGILLFAAYKLRHGKTT